MPDALGALNHGQAPENEHQVEHRNDAADDDAPDVNSEELERDEGDGDEHAERQDRVHG